MSAIRPLRRKKRDPLVDPERVWTVDRMLNELQRLRTGAYGRKHDCAEIARGIGHVHHMTVYYWLGPLEHGEGRWLRRTRPTAAYAERIRAFLINIGLHPPIPRIRLPDNAYREPAEPL